MENKKTEVAEQLIKIEELTKDFSISKYNLLKISFLIRLIEVTDEHAVECEVCKTNKDSLKALIEEIPKLDDIVHRRPYEKTFNLTRKHFHKMHGFIPPYHFTSRWSLFGGIIGVLIASLISFVLIAEISLDAVLAGVTLGVIIAYIISSFKEMKYRKLKKII